MTIEPRRLHRASIVLNALRALRELLLPIVVALVTGFSAGDGDPGFALLTAAVGVLGAVGAGYRRWATTTWWIDNGAIHLRGGLMSIDETIVPLSRIQAIDTSQNPIQRLFGIVELRVQAAGGGKAAEIVLNALTAADAEVLRAAVGQPDPAGTGTESMRLGVGALLLGALTAPQLGVLLPLVGGAASIADDVLAKFVDPSLVERLETPRAIVLVGTVCLLGAWLISIAGAIAAFFAFTLERDGDRLRIRRGLGERRVSSLPLSRIHAVSLVEGVLRQPLGLASLRVEVAGYRQEPATAKTLFPLIPRRDAEALLTRFVPELAGALGALERPPARAWRRYVSPPVLLAVVAAAILQAALDLEWRWITGIVAVLVFAAAAFGALQYRAAGWRIDAGRVVLSGRRLSRWTLVADTMRLQEHSLEQDPWQRRARLANFELAVGSGRTAGIADIDIETAEMLFEELNAGELEHY
ncbi:MAG: PH domain-containing protein [Actinomycetota bacterium]|nr:PH domain-containing protein [Actinomycetota bacterium]